MWVYLSNTKEPPVEPVRMILRKFGAKVTHRTVRSDQDKALGKSVEFLAMLKDEEFTPELTGTDSSQQNAIGERPHRDLAQMMRCMLHSAELGPAYWSFALAHAVYIKNCLPHSTIKTTPFPAFTGKRPDLSRLRIFGSRVFARKTGNRPAKLDNHASEGTFLTFTATDANVYYIDDNTGLVKMGQHVTFDEAHMTVPAGRAPLAAQALQRLGYFVKETWTKQAINDATDDRLRIHRLTETAILPSRGTTGSIGYDLHLDLPEITIEPGAMALLPTGIAVRPPDGTYVRIAPRSGVTVKRHLHTLAGVVDPDYTGNVTVVMHNFGTTVQHFKRGDKIAQLVIEQATTPVLVEVPTLTSTSRGTAGFGSTDKPLKSVAEPLRVPPPQVHADPMQREPPDHPMTAAAAAVELENATKDLHVAFRMPYDITLSDSPLDNQTFRTVTVTGNNPTLGFDLRTCKHFGLPQVHDCLKSTPAAKLPRWRSELRNAYVTSVNGKPVATVSQFCESIELARATATTTVEIGFATISKASMHPQLGIPQLYHDQLNIISDHIWDLRYNPEWHAEAEDALPILEVIRKEGTYENLPEQDKVKLQDVLLKAASVKKQRKLTRRILKELPDWKDWQQSEFKQLDQYHDQDTFGEPEPRPKGANLLSLLWCYLVKDDGRKKARCVCNGNKNRRGTVTLAETYAASLEQTASRVFWAATAINNFVTIGADASNAFSSSCRTTLRIC